MSIFPQPTVYQVYKLKIAIKLQVIIALMATIIDEARKNDSTEDNFLLTNYSEDYSMLW